MVAEVFRPRTCQCGQTMHDAFYPNLSARSAYIDVVQSCCAFDFSKTTLCTGAPTLAKFAMASSGARKLLHRNRRCGQSQVSKNYFLQLQVNQLGQCNASMRLSFGDIVDDQLCPPGCQLVLS